MTEAQRREAAITAGVAYWSMAAGVLLGWLLSGHPATNWPFAVAAAYVVGGFVKIGWHAYQAAHGR